jgi:hypothetical protein
MFSNLVRAAGTTTITLSVFKKFLHQLMCSGVIFPVIKRKEAHDVQLINEVVEHWVKFRNFFDKFYYYLQHSPKTQDVEVSMTLQKLRFLLERELTRASQSHRILSLYRGILSVVMAHQGAWMLATTAPTGVTLLGKELQALENIIFERHRQFVMSERNASRALQKGSAGNLVHDTSPIASYHTQCDL